MTATPKITYRQYGGKASIAKWIVSHFPQHRVYLECCAGSAAVLLAKPRSFVEIINDLDERVAGMWRAIKSQPEQLAAMLWATPYTAANWRDQPVGDIDQAVLLMAQARSSTAATAIPPLGRSTSARPHTSPSPRFGPTGSGGYCPPPIGCGASHYCTKTPWSQFSGSTATPMY